MSIKMTSKSNKQNTTIVDIDKLEATFGKGSVRSVTHLSNGDVVAEVVEGDANVPKNYKNEPIHFKYWNFALITSGKQGVKDLQTNEAVWEFTKYIVDKYPNWYFNNSWKDDEVIKAIDKMIDDP